MPQRLVPFDIRRALGTQPSVRPALDPQAVLNRVLPSFGGLNPVSYGQNPQATKTTDPIEQLKATLNQGYQPTTPTQGPTMQGPQPNRIGGTLGSVGSNLLDHLAFSSIPALGLSPFLMAQYAQGGGTSNPQPQGAGKVSGKTSVENATDFGLPTPPNQDFSTFIDDLLAQQSQIGALRDQAAQFQASLATASYDAQLKIIGQELAKYQEAQSKVDGLWTQWGADAQATIANAAMQAQQAYAQYIDLLNKGFNDYDAANTSRFREYQSQVQTLIQGYIGTTNKQYEEFMAELPEIWQPVIDAVATGNQAAMAAIRANEQTATESLEGQVALASERFGEEMALIGADNPALAQELLGELRSATNFAVEGAHLQADSGVRIEQAAGEVARTAAQYALASAMRQNEQERLTATNEARRTRQQLLTASDAELERLLEQSGFSREQALVHVNRDLEARLLSLDEAAAEVRQHARDSAAQMKYELSDAIQNLVNQQYTTGVNRSVAQTQILAAQTGQNAILSQIEVAEAYMLNVLQGHKGLSDYDRERIAENVVSWFREGVITGQETPQELAELAVRLESNLPPRSEWGDYLAAIKALGTGLTQYEEQYGSIVNGQTTYITPVQGEFTMVSPYGSRPNTRGGEGTEIHHGVDLNADLGTPLAATRGGTLSRYSNDSAGFGVQIEHGDGTASKYAHINGWNDVPPNGTVVTPGQLIGQVGASGNAKRPHLHFSFVVNGELVDPIAFGALVLP